MPCDSGYLEPTWGERELSRIACLIDQLKGKKKIDKDHWDGFHPRVYAEQVEEEVLIKEILNLLKGKDITKLSLELQIWHRDFLKDQKKSKLEKEKEKKIKLEKKKALAKLTPKERKLLCL
jgi:hypothetical protein